MKLLATLLTIKLSPLKIGFLRFFSVIIILIGCNSYAKHQHPNTRSKPRVILGVHSYSEDFPWTKMIVESYQKTLKATLPSLAISDVYFDVKKRPSALKAPHPLLPTILTMIETLKPNLIFITDDFAFHQMAPILIAKKIPFVFAGINGELPKSIIDSDFKSYTGVFERYYIADSLKLLQKLLHKKKFSVLILLEESETSEFVLKYAKEEWTKVPGISVQVEITSQFEAWKKLVLGSEKKFDAFFPVQHFALRDSNDQYVPATDVVRWFYEKSQKPVIFTAQWQIQCGGTLGIAHRPKAQGTTAAELSISALKEKFLPAVVPPVGDIAINYRATEKLGIEIPFDLLSTATIERTVQEPCRPN